MSVAFTTKRGDTFSIALTFKDADGVAINITGYTIFFTMKEDSADSDDAAIVSKDITSHTNAAAGLSLISLAAAETANLLGAYYFDIQYKDTSDNVITITDGQITFDEDITRRTS